MAKLLTPAELGQLIGLTEQTIYNRKNQGMPLPPAVKLGRLLRFPEDGVMAWIASLPDAGTVQTAPVPAPAPRKRGRPTKAEQIARRANP